MQSNLLSNRRDYDIEIRACRVVTENGESIVQVDVRNPQFWTVYERNDFGLWDAMQDLPTRKEAVASAIARAIYRGCAAIDGTRRKHLYPRR